MNENPSQGQTGYSEAVSQLQNIARQLSAWVQSVSNATPQATTTTSPRFTAVALSTTAVAVIGTSALRHGLLLHNPGTATVYIYQTGMTSAPTTAVLAGAVVIFPGNTLSFPSAMFPNINAGFSAFSGTGSSQPFTVVEFF